MCSIPKEEERNELFWQDQMVTRSTGGDCPSSVHPIPPKMADKGQNKDKQFTGITKQVKIKKASFFYKISTFPQTIKTNVIQF